ncbi:MULTISPECIES: hypothetical protein [unclassified Nostoc]|uniref:hypothetical protein n=1 Tax=unclassified Nostoc TaxID=2593658 RepID=UPI002AD20DE8|nr:MULTISPECIES: hypothetical protein [unclassified Nostoc]MDZ8121913.1 hypothetical protein [Nostoc sp. CmiVER01]MDZ8221416.1 hypothetical protein [Nostoc sp. ChiVER01]
MKSDHPRPSNFNHKLNAPKAFVLRAANAEQEQQFHALLKHVMTAVSKDSSNNVAIVAITAMFFALAVMVLKPSIPVPPAIMQSNPTTTVTTHQEQIQRIDDDGDAES